MPAKRKQTKLGRLGKFLKPTSPQKGALLFVIAFAVIGGGTLVASHAATLHCINYTYRQGSSGHCVSDIQGMLNYDEGAGLAVDGSYGVKTTNAVKIRQAFWNNVFHTNLAVDGVVGPNTWKIVCDPEKGPVPLSYQLYAKDAGCPGY